MIFKKFCTICNCEYDGDVCPECSGKTNVMSETKKIQKTGKPKKKKHFQKKTADTDEMLQQKIQQLMNKYNNK